MCQDYDNDQETFSPTPQSEDSDIEQRQNDENLFHRSPIRTRQTRRILIEEDDEEDNNEISPRKTRMRTNSETQQPNGLEMNGTVEGEDELGTSIYERIKRRRQQQQALDEDSGPPKKRSYITQNGTTKQEVSSDSEEEEVENTGRRYFFRRNRAQVIRLQDEYALKNKNRHGRSVHFRREHSHPSHRSRRSSKRHRQRRGSNSGYSESSSTSDSDLADAERDIRAELKFEKRKLKSLQKGRSRFMPMNISQQEWSEKKNFNQLTSHHSTDGLPFGSGDVEPMGVDKTATFEKIGGLDEHVQSLKEAIVFPLLYPEMFEKFEISPPKGVLFYGPPGTGKTLVARALANECSKDGRKVSFFMRKGADCLSKWVGESERQLRLLFDQAYKMRPSIIFFDEIDGLAPMRSSRQDQIHSSIVSTLLALMDGLDNRGQVVVVGATNRLDTLDPAIRRPGRFDRELRFDLPDKVARESILNIHTNGWKDGKPDSETLKALAEQTSGYCGADLKALCAEAVLVSIRTTFPHLYLSEDKLELDVDTLQVKKQHFDEALRRIIPASRRDFSASSFSINHRINVFIQPVVTKTLQTMIPNGYLSRKTSINGITDLQRVVDALRIPQSVPAARVILFGDNDQGQTRYFINSFISSLDHLPVFTLTFSKLYANSQPEENLSSCFLSITRATSRGTPALLVLPDLDKLEQNLPSSLWQMLISSLNLFDGFTPLLIIASVQRQYSKCNTDIKSLFSERHGVEITPPTKAMSREYFRKIANEALQEPTIFDANKYPTPQKAKSQVNQTHRRMSEREIKQLEENYEQMLRQFRIFLRDMMGRLIRDRRFNAFHLPVNVEDAEDYYQVIENPLSLSDMMNKIDQKVYDSKALFLEDIKLIRDNALEYNPNMKMEDKVIRHNAIGLMDVAEALFETELDESFEERMKKTSDLIKEAKAGLEKKDENVDFATTPRRRKNSRQEQSDSAERKPNVSPLKSDRKGIQIDKHKLDDFVDKAVNRTHDWPIQKLESLGVQLVQIIQQYSNTWDRTELPSKLLKEIMQSGY
ncbi:Bromo domain-containing protein [Aphelenchoides bicaudatus]|nr:Bromo domain-containing protein [Aphelenchoides bicaudatus]